MNMESIRGAEEVPKLPSVPNSEPAGTVKSGNKTANYQPSFKTDTTSKTKKSLRLSDLMAAMYPGVKIGHKHCVQRPVLVPKTMGWLWNSEDTMTGVPLPRGYRPGAIALGVKKGMTRPRLLSEPSSTPIGSKGRKIRRRLKTPSSINLKFGTPDLLPTVEETRPPTLYVKKEGGVYRVVMQPIKDAAAVEGAEDEPPVQFKIAEDSTGSSSRHSASSSSSLKIEYICTGSMRKPIVKPEFIEIATQYDITDTIPKEVPKIIRSSSKTVARQVKFEKKVVEADKQKKGQQMEIDKKKN